MDSPFSRHVALGLATGFALLGSFCSRDAQTTGRRPAVAAHGQTLSERFPAPADCTPVAVEAGSYGEYLRRLPLKPPSARVRDHAGNVVDWGDNLGAVLDVDLITWSRTSDLQQCADLAMRLWGEYRWHEKTAEGLSFRLQNGQSLAWKDWRDGVRGKVVGSKHIFADVGSTDASYANFRAYLAYVMHWLGSAGIKTYATKIDEAELRPGDLFVQNSTGAIGHVTILADVCERGDERLYLVVQSYMPAQEGHVVLPDPGAGDGAWFSLEGLRRHQSHFGPGVLRRLP